MRRFHLAKLNRVPQVVIWGTGSPKREFLHVQDLAEALILLMERYEEPQTINVGSGQEFSIFDLAELMKEVVGFEGEITQDPTKPDGTPRKLLDISKVKSLGWNPRINLKEGLQETYQWALENEVF